MKRVGDGTAPLEVPGRLRIYAGPKVERLLLASLRDILPRLRGRDPVASGTARDVVLFAGPETAAVANAMHGMGLGGPTANGAEDPQGTATSYGYPRLRVTWTRAAGRRSMVWATEASLVLADGPGDYWWCEFELSPVEWRDWSRDLKRVLGMEWMPS